jgi:DNA polymerase-3 subunit beta
MILACLQENLHWALRVVERVVTPRGTNPAVNNILLETDQSRLKLVATNLETTVACWIGARVEEEGVISVAAKTLNEIVYSLPRDRVDISIAPKTTTVSIRCARYEARLSGNEAKGFPPSTAERNSIVTSVQTEELRQAINKIIFAVAAEDSRPVLKGVDAKFEGSSVTLAAADGFRLAVCKMNLKTPISQGCEIVIPGSTLRELNRILSGQIELETNNSAEIVTKRDIASERVVIYPLGSFTAKEIDLNGSDDQVEIIVNPTKSQVWFRLRNIELVSSLIRGTFPQYEQLIPKTAKVKLSVNGQEFLKSAKFVAKLTDDAKGIIRLLITPGTEFAPGKITVYSRSECLGESVCDIDAIVNGNASKIALNPKYLLEVINALSDLDITLELTDPSSPCVIKPIGFDNYIHVLMPMFVEW